MSDLPPLKLANEKRNAILDLINESFTVLPPFEEGDVTIEDIAKTYGVKYPKARVIMSDVAKNNPQIKKIMVTLPDSYHCRPGYVLRYVDDSDSGDHKGTPADSLI